MSKDFNAWNEKKKKLNEIEPHFYREGEVWWCSVGVNVGVEMDGKGTKFDRPVVIIKSFGRDALIGIPLTGCRRDGRYYVYLGKILNVENSAIISQIRLFDARRLIMKISTLDGHLFSYLQISVRNLIFPQKIVCPRFYGGLGANAISDVPEFTFTGAGP